MRVLWAALALTAAAAARPGEAPGLAAIGPRSIAARVRFLSSEVLEGRGTGTRGLSVAEAYVAAEMLTVGLEPAGEAGTFLQAVPLRAWRVDQGAASLSLAGPGHAPLELLRGEDFVALCDGENSEVEVDAPLVLAGYGISAPEFGYDDLRSADLRGKIAVVLDGAPLSDRQNYFPPAAHAVYGDRTDKIRRLSERGAAGVLFVFGTEAEEGMPWGTFARKAREEGMGWLEGTRLGSRAGGAPARAVLSRSGFEKLLAAAAVPGGARAVLEKSEAGRLFSQVLALRARLRSSAEMREFTSHNVVGLLRGDGAGAGEVVVVSAHLDHSDPAGDGDPGSAGDNAAGVSVLLEVAKAFAALSRAPRRSVLFLGVTGAEQGLVGSQFFVRHPPLPRERLVAELNIDRAPTASPFLNAVAFGAADSTLGGAASAGAAAVGVELSPDPDPRSDGLARSDQYSFVLAGIPSLFVAPGRRGADPEDRKKGTARDGALDWESLARFARLQFSIGLAIADGAERPSWNAGDFLERVARRAAP